MLVVMIKSIACTCNLLKISLVSYKVIESSFVTNSYQNAQYGLGSVVEIENGNLSD